MWPTSGDFSGVAGGTEFFLSSNAAGEVGSGSSSQIAVWALTHTRRLSLSHAAPRLQAQFVHVPRYVQPPSADQKPGPTPLRSCLNDRTMATPFGPGCWQYFSGSIVPPGQPPAHFQRLAHLDANDSRMQQTVLNNGLVWGALDTGVWAGGHSVPGVAYYAVAPVIRDGRLDAHLVHTGTFAVAGESISYPAIAMLHNGKGAIAVTLGGHGYYPSAAYALVQGGAGRCGACRGARRWAVRHVQRLSGVRAAVHPALGRLRRGDSGRRSSLDRVGVHRSALLPDALPRGHGSVSVRHVRNDPGTAGQLVDADLAGIAVA